MQHAERSGRDPLRRSRVLAAVVLAALLAACGSAPRRGPERLPEAPAPATRGGGYYLDDGPGAEAPANLAAIPDAVPRVETLNRGTMRPYVVMGKNYTPMTELTPYKARGIASWYGRRYHGKPTSSGELYDMYGMTAAHTVLPIPSYVRVTNVGNGKSVVLRVNDRGPFIADRLIDLSYTAAWKLGLLGGGSGMVEVESILPGRDPVPPAAALPSTPVAPAATPLPAEPPVTTVALPPSPPVPAVAVPPAVPVAAATAAPAAAGPGSYVQFGAFGLRENAESFLARLQTQADWLAGSLRITQTDNLYRVQAGPYASEAAARDIAERAAQALGTKPVVLTR